MGEEREDRVSEEEMSEKLDTFTIRIIIRV